MITLILDDGLNHAYIEDARPSPIVPAFTQFCITRNKLPALPGGIERPVATANAKAMHASKLHVVIFAAIIGLFCVAFLSVQAQDVQLESGNLTFLRGETAVCVKYVYDGMLIGTNNEADYIKYKVAFFNKKEPGKGEKWLAGSTTAPGVISQALSGGLTRFWFGGPSLLAAARRTLNIQ